MTVEHNLDGGYPWLERISADLSNGLIDAQGGTTHLAEIRSALDQYLYDDDSGWPFFETIHNDLNFLLAGGNGEPLLQGMRYDLDYYLMDNTNIRPWMETLSGQLASLLTILNDVHDAAQHALKTV